MILLILGGTIYYFKSTAEVVQKLDKESNTTQTKEVKKTIASMEADSNTSLNPNNKDNNKENMDSNNNKIINTLPNKDENSSDRNSLQEDKNDTNLDKSGSIHLIDPARVKDLSDLKPKQSKPQIKAYLKRIDRMINDFEKILPQ